MKTRYAALTAAVITAAIIMAALSGCVQPVSPTGLFGEPPAAGMGRVSISVGSTVMKTINPTTPSSAAEYVVTFTDQSNTKVFNEDRITGASTRSYDLFPGTYKLEVWALNTAGAATSTSYAYKEITGISVSLGSVQTQTVALELPAANEGETTGIFAWNVTLPTGLPGTATITSATLTLTRVSGKVNLSAAGTDQISSFPINLQTTSSDNRNLFPGNYDVKLEVIVDGYYYIATDVLRVNSNLTSTLSATISASDFPTNGAVSIIISVSQPKDLNVTISGGSTSTVNGNTLLTVNTGATASLSVPAGATSIQWTYFNGTSASGVSVGTSTTLTITGGTAPFVSTGGGNPAKPLCVTATLSTGEYVSKTIMVKINP